MAANIVRCLALACDKRDTDTMRSLRPVPYGDLLARNLRAARAAVNLSQRDVGERMRNLGFSAWLRSTMSLAEQGKRRVTAEELLALALVLETSMVRLAAPPEETPWIELPAGGFVHGTAVRGAGEVQWTGNTPKFVRDPGVGSAWMGDAQADPLGTARALADRSPDEQDG